MTDATTKPSLESVEKEFDMLLAKAGVPVMAERKAGIIAAYAEQIRLSEIVRGPRPFSHEPANVYNLQTIVRSR